MNGCGGFVCEGELVLDVTPLKTREGLKDADLLDL